MPIPGCRTSGSISRSCRAATVAAAASIALFVAGPEGWHRLARALGIRYVILVDGEDRVHLSPELHERIEIIDRYAPLEISPPLTSVAQR
jgi:thiamine biosynthesis lipoprotein